jgi:uncharacterized protein
MTEQPVTFRSGALTLEGLMAISGAGAPAAVVCHPHPLYGGSMYNNVVEAILEALWQLGHSTLRFNFRGVGDSQGIHDRGAGECDDAAAALRFLLGQPGVRADGAVMAGYSFGAMVALRAGLKLPEVAKIAAVALPVAMASTAPAPASKPLLLVSGDADSYSPTAELQSLAKTLGARLKVIAGADHFFAGYEPELTRALVEALAEG